MQTVKVPLDEDNDLFFDLTIESTESVTPPTARLVCETKSFDYSFKGTIENGEVKVHVPIMEGRLPVGKYDAKLEVFVGNKVFTPLEFQVDFAKSVRVVAEIKNAKHEDKEVVTATLRKPSRPTVSEADSSKLADRIRQKKLLEAQKRKSDEAKKREEVKRAKLKRQALLKKKQKLEEAARKKQQLAEQARRKNREDDELRTLLEQALIED